MEVRAQLEGEDLGKKVKKNMDELGTVVREAMRETAQEMADVILFRGAEDIAGAGNFGEDWQEALNADIEETQRTIRVNVYMDAKEPPVTFWKVFEYGADIKAKNPSGYLWLPFKGAEGTDVWPRAYDGELFRATSKRGTPLLGDKETKEWKYFGLEEVTIPKKFHLHEIIREEAAKLGASFRRILKENRQG
jgi:hypothetical protein